MFAPGDKEPIRSALTWRVFDARADAEGAHALIAESQDATPSFSLPDGDYIVHVACGLAGATRQITVYGAPITEKVAMNAGGAQNFRPARRCAHPAGAPEHSGFPA